MKKVFILPAFALLFLTSCTKEENGIYSSMKAEPVNENVDISYFSKGGDEFELNTTLLTFEEIEAIAQSLKNETGTGIISDSTIIEQKLSPLVENGKLLQEELITKSQNSPEWTSLSQTEKYAIVNMSDNQLAELSLIYSMSLGEIKEGGLSQRAVDWGTIRSCLSGALGLGDLYYILVENPRALMSAQGAIKALKHVGLRYLGWIGLGLAVWDFIDCVS